MLSQVLAPSHVPKLEMPNGFAFDNIIYPINPKFELLY